MLHSELRDQVGMLTLDDGKANAVSDVFSAALEAGLDFALAGARAAALDAATCAGIMRRLRAATAHLMADSLGIELNDVLGIRGA